MATGKRKQRSRNRTLESATVLGGNAAGAEIAAPEIAGSDMLFAGLERFLDDATAKSRMRTGQLKGFLFERLEATKINVDAVRKGLNIRARLTADTAGGGTNPRVDIEIVRNGRVVEEIQAKASDNPRWLAKAHSQPKYAGTTRLVPDDMEKRVNEGLAGSLRVTGKLEQSRASSGGTTIRELRAATDHPRLYAVWKSGMQMAREAMATGACAAAAGAIFGCAISSIKNVRAYARGEIGKNAALSNVMDDATHCGVRSGAAGVLGTVIRHSAGKVGMIALRKANVATATAAASIEAGRVVHECATGRISDDAAAERLGKIACTTLAAVYFAKHAGKAFGPVGAVAGSIVGYVLADTLYEFGAKQIRESMIARGEGERLVSADYGAALFSGTPAR